ncbi:MAG TPA: iron-sulfur cluster repair di-iron protein [Chitinophagaceae bacterium]|nr:iron-sulfur cluster repair di-iron protein [Chitinophagaceae bacterium]
MENITHLNVSVLEPRLKHSTIFACYDQLAPGASLVIHNDHDPKPLYYQLLGERGNSFQWEYLEQGPEWWQIKITRNPVQQKDPTLGELAAADFRKAQVFKRYGLDFCCGGKKTLHQACTEKKISESEVIRELHEVDQLSSQESLHYNEWDPAFLADFIVNNHHAYVKKSVVPLNELATKVARVHGQEHPETRAIAELVGRVTSELSSHMVKEEQVLFPYIKQLTRRAEAGEPAGTVLFGSVQNPVQVMEDEHEQVGRDMARMKELSGGFAIPEGACASFTLLYKWLSEFEEDLTRHVHLENNILFPKAIELEKQIA